MKILEVTEEQKTEYNNFVAAQTSGSFLQSWEWGEWQESLGRQVFRFKVQGSSEETVAVVQLIKMPLPLKRYYLYAPYGPVVQDNFQFSISNFQLILNEIKSQFSDAVFIRFESKSKTLNPQPSTLTSKSPNIQPAKTLVLDLEKSEPELLAAMHNKTRYNIKVAQKHGVEIKDEFEITNGHGLFFDEAIKLISQTANRQKFNTFPASYYKQMADRFTLGSSSAVKLHIYKAVFSAPPKADGSASCGQNQLLATAFMVDFGKTRTFLFGGSSEEHKNVMAPYLLHWQAITDAKKMEMSIYDFWGIETSSGETPGFVRFKMGFAPENPEAVKEYGGAYHFIINKHLYKLYGAFRKLNSIKRKILS